ncbi:winged helix-turn-helix domain-containing protein [Shewanella sp.]|uniref:winged helix-turn-helix domain-containing protein n=1 Tax=Shewanella sp. TaxID=50422 RepID=UPI003A98775B
MAEDIRVYICNDLHVSYRLANVYRLLHALNFSWIIRRSKYLWQSDEAQEAFNKLPEGTILHIPSHLPLERVDGWFQAEARFDQRDQRQDFGQSRAVVPVSSNSSHLIMGICLGRCAQVVVKRKH